MEPGNEEPFDREAWRKLMGAATGAPTKEIDRRILAEARRALVPHIGRWWLPASLAASLLLAVLLVQRQVADVGAPAAVTESDVLSAAPAANARDNAVPSESDLPELRQEAPAEEAPVPPPRVDLPDMETVPPAMESQGITADAAPAAQAPASPPMAITSKTVSSPPPGEQERLRNQEVTVTAARAAPAADAAPTAEQGESETKSAGMLGAVRAKESYAESRTPEQWVKDIAALRASGHIQEADAELARFKSRYPDWLAQHHQKDP